MRTKFGVIVCLLLASFMPGCSSTKAPSTTDAAAPTTSSISGAEATQSIQAIFKPQADFELTDDEVERGVSAGYWVTGVSPNSIISKVSGFYKLTAPGKRLFRAIGHTQQGVVVLTLRQIAAPYVVRLGTITENKTSDPLVSEQIVPFDYNCRFDDVPPEIHELLRGHPPLRGIAVLRSSDHGWRVVSATPVQRYRIWSPRGCEEDIVEIQRWECSMVMLVRQRYVVEYFCPKCAFSSKDGLFRNGIPQVCPKCGVRFSNESVERLRAAAAKRQERELRKEAEKKSWGTFLLVIGSAGILGSTIEFFREIHSDSAAAFLFLGVLCLGITILGIVKSDRWPTRDLSRKTTTLGIGIGNDAKQEKPGQT